MKYRGVRILWPIFLPQLAMLRHYAGYRTTDHRDQACLYLLEDCAITSLLAFDAQLPVPSGIHVRPSSTRASPVGFPAIPLPPFPCPLFLSWNAPVSVSRNRDALSKLP